MNASPHAHTYEGNKKETKRTNNIQICMQDFETNGNACTNINALENNKYTRSQYRQLHNTTSLNKK